MKLAGNSKLLKKLNRLQALDCIRGRDTISMSEIRTITGLTPTTISEISNSLIEEGFVLDMGVGNSTGGRPSRLLTINPGYGYFIGADIDVGYVRVVLVDFSMKIVCSLSLDVDGFNFEKIVGFLTDGISHVMDKSGVSKDRIRGIGIAAPALISSEGIIEFAPNLNWTMVDIKSAVKARFDLPVMVENESKLSAVAEKHIGWGRNTDNFMTINIKSGVGSGIYIKGLLYRGTSGNAGELGHMTVKEDGPLCGCGNYGCLETMASTPSIIQRAVTYRKQGENSLLFDRVENVEDITLEDIIRAYKDGDELCSRILQSASKYLAIGISGVINLINPGLIVLGGDLVLYQEVLLPRIMEIVERKALFSNRSVCEIKTTSLGKESTVLGAAIAAMNKHLGYTGQLEAYI